MLKITRRQFAAFEAEFRRGRRFRFLTALRVCGWVPHGMTDAAAYRTIEAAVEDAKTVDIVEDEDAVRFAALAFLPEPVRHRPGFAMMAGRILNDRGVDAKRRMDLLFRIRDVRHGGRQPAPFPPYHV